MQEAAKCAGLGAGSNGRLDPKRTAEVFNKVRNNTQLRRICELAGRYRRVAQGKQKAKAHHGYGDVVGIKLDDVVENLLEEETALLLVPGLKLDTLRRLAEKETLALDRRDEERLGKGPICVIVDESGSMGGEPLCQAKAFALAMAWIARHQKRWCMLVGFSGGTTGTTCFLPPTRWDENDLLDWLAHDFGGGTSHHVLCEDLPNSYWQQAKTKGMPMGTTDIIVISDAEIRIPPETEQSFKKWKSDNKCKSIGVLLNVDGAGGMNGILDEYYNTKSLGLDQEFINKCFSL